MKRNPRLQRGNVSLDPTWKRQGQKLMCIQQLEIRGRLGRGQLAVLEGKMVGRHVKRPVKIPGNEKKHKIAICPQFVVASKRHSEA